VDAKIDKLAEYVMNEVPTRREVDAKIDKLAEYVLNEVPTKKEVDEKFQKVYDAIWNLEEKVDQKADKKDVEMLMNNLRELLDGQDEVIKQLDIIRTEQYAFNAGLNRIEERVESLESES